MQLSFISRFLPVVLGGLLAAHALATPVTYPVTYTLNATTDDGSTITGSILYAPALASIGGTIGGSFMVDEVGTTGIPAHDYTVTFSTASEANGIQSALFYNVGYSFALDLNFLPNPNGVPTLCVVGSCPIGTMGQTASTSTFYRNSSPYPGDPLKNGTFSATPEPGGLALLGTGLCGCAALVRRRIVRA